MSKLSISSNASDVGSIRSCGSLASPMCSFPESAEKSRRLCLILSMVQIRYAEVETRINVSNISVRADILVTPRGMLRHPECREPVVLIGDDGWRGRALSTLQ